MLPRRRLRDRSTSDLLVMMIAATICFSVVLGGAVVLLIEAFNPEQDTSQALRAVTGVINTLVGLLAGFLAGRTGVGLPPVPPEEESEKDPPPKK